MLRKSKTTTPAPDQSAKAQWRAAKSADLAARSAALQKLAARPDPNARSPKPIATSPNDATTIAPPGETNHRANKPAPIDQNADGANVAPAKASSRKRGAPATTADHQQPAERRKDQDPAKPAAHPKPRKDSCLSIAARLLAHSASPLSAQALIDLMAAKGLWTSPNGKTPAATLYAAITREIAAKGDKARFRKHERGLFVAGQAS